MSRKFITSKDLNIGDSFIIRDSPYPKEKYVITDISGEAVYCTNVNWHDDKIHIFRDTNLYYWGDHVQIISRASDDAAVNRASLRLLQPTLAKEHQVFEKTFNALKKAEKEFRENKSIRFENGRLTFISRDSGKKRYVTKNGCFDCDCQNGISYHAALYVICEEAAKDSVEVFAVGQKAAA